MNEGGLEIAPQPEGSEALVEGLELLAPRRREHAGRTKALVGVWGRSNLRRTRAAEWHLHGS